MKVGVIDGEEFVSHALIPIPDLRASMSAQTTASLLRDRLYPGVNFESRTNTERAEKPRATVSIQKSFGIGFEFVAAFAGSERVRTWRWRTALLRSLARAPCVARNMLRGRPWKYRFHLRLQRRGVERLDDVVADASLLRGNDVFSLRLRGDHDEGRLRKFRAGTDFPEQIVAGHRLHVPVRNHQAVFLALHLGERRRSVAGIVDIFESNLLEQIADDPNHGVVVIDHQDRHRQIEGHVFPPRVWKIANRGGD